MEVRSDVAAAAEDVVARSVELLFQKRRGKRTGPRCGDQVLGRQAAVGAAPQVEAHALENRLVQRDVPVEQALEVGHQLGKSRERLPIAGFREVGQRDGAQEDKDFIGTGDGQRPAVLAHRAALRDDLGDNLVALESAFPRVFEAAPVGEFALPGGAGAFLDALRKHRLRPPASSALGGAGLQREAAIDGSLRSGDRQRNDVVRAGSKDAALKASAVVAPGNRGDGGAEIHGALVAGDFSLGGHPQFQVACGDERIRPVLTLVAFGVGEGDDPGSRLLVFPIGEQLPELRQDRGGIRRRQRGVQREVEPAMI